MKKYMVVSLYYGRQCLGTSSQPQKGLFDNEADADKYKQELYKEWESIGETYDPVYRVICLNVGK